MKHVKLYGDFTLGDLLKMAARIHKKVGSGRKEPHYQKCLATDLRLNSVPCACEDPVPVFYHGVCVWLGRADIVVGKCCIELKALSKVPSEASEQLSDYIREKNKVSFLQDGTRPYWGVCINFNKRSGKTEHFVLRDTLDGRWSIEDEHSEDAMRRPDVSPYFQASPQEDVVEKRARERFTGQNRPYFQAEESMKHRSLLRDLTRFSEFHLRKTRDPTQTVLMDDVVEHFENMFGRKVAGTELAFWVRKFFQKHYRVSYDRATPRRRQVVYGGVERGLELI